MVLILRAAAFHVVVWQLRLDQVHLGTELRSLSQLGIALRGRRAAEGFAVLVFDQPSLARVLADGHVDLLRVLMVVEGCHVLLWVLVPIRFAHLDHRVPLRAEGSVIRVRVLRIGGI